MPSAFLELRSCALYRKSDAAREVCATASEFVEVRDGEEVEADVEKEIDDDDETEEDTEEVEELELVVAAKA